MVGFVNTVVNLGEHKRRKFLDQQSDYHILRERRLDGRQCRYLNSRNLTLYRRMLNDDQSFRQARAVPPLIQHSVVAFKSPQLVPLLPDRDRRTYLLKVHRTIIHLDTRTKWCRSFMFTDYIFVCIFLYPNLATYPCQSQSCYLSLSIPIRC